MEAIIRDHPTIHRLINSFQHGFMKRSSFNLPEFFEMVNNNLDNSQPMYLIYLDFKQAFDTVPMERLLVKLKAHSITDNLHTWI